MYFSCGMSISGDEGEGEWKISEGWMINSVPKPTYPAFHFGEHGMIYGRKGTSEVETISTEANWTKMPSIRLRHCMLQFCEEVAIKPCKVGQSKDDSILVLIDSPSWSYSPRLDPSVLHQNNCINYQHFANTHNPLAFAIFLLQNKESLRIGYTSISNQDGKICL